MTPHVTVLMSVHNDIPFLPSAVESILSQTFRDFELLIVDDGSTDGSADFLAQITDSRVRLWRNDQNMGLTYSLKLGVEMAQGPYLARMDSDDIARPDRLMMQVAFLDQHPEIGILGSGCQKIDATRRVRGAYSVPVTDLHIRWTSLIANPFVHPTIMIRRDILTHHHLNYDERCLSAQDYELWTRLLKHTRGANLSAQLLQYRIRHGITGAHRQAQLANHDTIALRTIREQLPDFAITPVQVSDLRALLVGGRESRPGLAARRAALADLYLNMLQAFARQQSGASGLRELQSGEAARVARFFLLPSLPPSAGRIIKRLTAIDPLWPVRLAFDLSSALVRRVRWG